MIAGLEEELNIEFAGSGANAWELLKKAGFSVLESSVPNGEGKVGGAAFTVNPESGADTEIVVEVVRGRVEGLGVAAVSSGKAESAKGFGVSVESGKAEAARYVFDWYKEEYLEKPETPEALLEEGQLREIMDGALRIQELFGYPCEIKFVFDENILYILQVKAITEFHYTGIPDIWSTAGFRDEGVAAGVCTPYMWSLYEYIWEYTLRKFLLDSKILRKKDVKKKLGEMFYGRPYWNLSVVKSALGKVFGCKERELDSQLGVKITYDGDGQTAKITPASLLRLRRITKKQKEIAKDREEHAEEYKRELLEIYEDYLRKYQDSENREEDREENAGMREDIHEKDLDGENDIEQLWYRLTRKDYLRSESTYFWQIFMDTIHHILYRGSFLKYVSEEEYRILLLGMDRIPRRQPFYDMWELTRQMRKNQVTMHFWNEHSVEAVAAMMRDTDRFGMKEAKDFIAQYGYHSDKEPDVAYPCYYEDAEAVVALFKDMLGLGDERSPLKELERQKEEYARLLQEIEAKISKAKYRKLAQQIEDMRKMLWWREEFRDISARFYYIIRIYTMELAKAYVEQGILEEEEDIWYLKVGDLWDFMEQKTEIENLREIIRYNRRYYKSFRNFMSEDEIGGIL